MIAGDDLVATPSQTVGPFFHVGLTPNANVGAPSDRNAAELIRLRVSVTDGDGLPVPDAWLELWNAAASEPSLAGRLATDENGACEFEVVRAGTHLNVCLFARGLLRHLNTRVYFAGESSIQDDPVLALVPESRRATLAARPETGDSRRWRFDIRLQGDDETVFFAV